MIALRFVGDTCVVSKRTPVRAVDGRRRISRVMAASAKPREAGLATGVVAHLSIDVEGEQNALALIERLRGFHAELEPAGDGCCRVRIELDATDRDRQLASVIDRIRVWLVEGRLARASADLDGRTFTIGS